MTYKRKLNKTGGNNYKTKLCSQSFTILPLTSCLEKKCMVGSKTYKDNQTKLTKLNQKHDKFVAKECNIPIDKYGQLLPETPDQWDCNSKQRKGKLFETILKLEKQTSTFDCKKKM